MKSLKTKMAPYLTIGGAVGIIVWAIGKSCGIIHSPTFVEMLPYIFGGGSIIGIAFQSGKLTKQVDNVSESVKKIGDSMEVIGKEVIKVTVRFDDHVNDNPRH